MGDSSEAHGPESSLHSCQTTRRRDGEEDTMAKTKLPALVEAGNAFMQLTELRETTGRATMDLTTLMERLDAVLPAIRARREDVERERRLTREVARALHETGIAGLEVPRALGGFEAEPAEILRAIELVSRADGSTGWCIAQSVVTGGCAGYMDEAGAREVFADPTALTAGVTAPSGGAQRVEGGVRVSGRWQFASGIHAAEWVFVGCMVMENGQPRMTAQGPEIVYAFLPAKAFEIHDTWFVSGLCGTGSNDVSVKDAFVPSSRIFTLGAPAASRSEPLYRMPPFGWYVAHVAAVALGIARSALDELTALAQSRVPTFSVAVLADRPAAQLGLARGEAALGAARAFLHASIEELWQAVKAGEQPTQRQVAQSRIAAAHACEVGASVTRSAGVLAGGSAIHASSSLQRHLRDADAVAHHFSVSPHVWEDAGRVFMGRSPLAPMF
jgi:alkylation response protein AidB-like acyl-CoA dehydrogenase